MSVKLVRITTVPISMRLLITDQPRYMKQKGFDVSLVSSEGEDWKQIPELDKYNVHKLEMARRIDVKGDLVSLYRLIKLFRKIKPDIVHSHTPKAGLLGMMAAWITGVPVRIHTLAGMPLMTATGMKRKLLFHMEKLTFKFSGEVWPNSGKLLQFVLDNKMADPKKVRMILNGSSNGIDLGQYAKGVLNPKRLEDLKKQYDIRPDQFCYLAVGRMVNDKGIKELLTAFMNLFARFPHLRLFLLGPFEESDSLPQEMVQLIKTHPAITHIDWSNEVAYFMALCQCFVHASHREGFPNVVLQAGAMGIPVIVSDIPGNADIVQQESEGFLYPVKDAVALEKQMLTVLTDSELALQKARVLQEKVTKNYERGAVHAAIKDRYVSLLNSNKINVSTIL